MPMFIPRPGNVGNNPLARTVRTVVRSSTTVQKRVVPSKDSRHIPVVKRINPPNTIKPQQPTPIRSVARVIERKKPAVHVGKSKSVVSSALRAQHDNLLSAHTIKINALKNIGKGRILIMVACGPSISELQLERLNGQRMIDIMSINKPDMRVWPTKYWAFCDQSQHKRNEDTFEAYSGILINSSSIRARHKNQILIRNRSGSGFSLDLTQGFFIGRSTTYANMQTALWMGYNRIYILGMDMAAVEKNGEKVLHFYGKNPDVADKNREARFEMEAKSYEFAAGYLPEEDRKKFYMCSSYNPWGFTSRFNKMRHEGIVDEILSYANSISQT
jgi:hypothetical protein